MGIDQKDQIHGAVFAKIVEHKTFKSLNKFLTKGSHGCYTVNDNIGIYVKYCKAEKHSKTECSSWQFNFQPDDIDAWKELKNKTKESFLCLVCSMTGVCMLEEDQADSFLKNVEKNSQKTIRVTRPKTKGGFRLTPPKGKPILKISLNAFPKKLFQRLKVKKRP